MVDMVVHRHQLRATLANLCRLLTKAPAVPVVAPPRELDLEPVANEAEPQSA